MIHIITSRCGLIAVAVTFNDNEVATFAIGLTEDSASRRLCRKVARQ